MIAGLIAAAVLTQDAWDDYPAFVWRSRYASGEPPAALLEGLGGVDVKRGEDADWARARGLAFYVGQAAGRDDLHIDADRPSWTQAWDEWVATRDPELLSRRPCLSDPATLARLDQTLATTLSNHAAGTGLFVSLGDEISLTPSQGVPWDGCRSKTCQAERGSAPTPTTDAVRLAWTQGDTSQLGAWLDLRRFHRGVVERAVLGRMQGREGLSFGVLGLVGATPFGGLDLRRILSAVDVVEAYPDGDARADVETLRAQRPGLRSLLTVFMQQERPAGVAWQASEHWVRGGDGVVVWNDALLEDHPEAAAALRAAVARVRELKETVGGRPVPAGAAVLRDDDSRALAFLQEALLDGKTWPNRFPSYQARNGKVERAVETWLRYFEDVGLHPGVVRFGDLDAARFPLLALPHVGVVGDENWGELVQFLENNGVLLIEGEVGRFDRDGRARDASLKRWFEEEYPERVLSDRLPRYLERRLQLAPADRRALLPEEAWEALSDAGHAALPIASEGGLPWLVTRRDHPTGGGSIFAAIPNLTSTAERELLAAARIRPPGVPAGMTLTWIHPRPDPAGEVIVPAGQPLVFAVHLKR